MGWNVFAAALAAFAAFFAPAIAHAAIWTDGDGITWAYAEGDDSATVTNVANAEYDVTIPAPNSIVKKGAGMVRRKDK